MRRHQRPARGFTLLELSTVLAILAVLSSLSILSYGGYVRLAKANAVEIQLRLIADMERARPGGPIPCAASPAQIPQGAPAPWIGSEGFRRLGFATGQTDFQYEVQVPGPQGAAFVVLARGDLDGDGRASLYSLRADQAEIERVESLE
ncbi:prepilin-type N-terminal cleavage/methylation domain-containing protein [Myxococcota bacterium]|nr:prepilin-type N-terminal cleavage/methylation domain-containing protein [Myxococcota bacterium]MBU1432417.1 prepilin-type N-terminal cleavage/methylation domain-containing protein [Myxococcota bacterium]MBU1897311.1 prepilin-type N-terminal cleavage/methylation domain-containing protein [Myxococcota bacterium]